jgi:hypothetical protein
MICLRDCAGGESRQTSRVSRGAHLFERGLPRPLAAQWLACALPYRRFAWRGSGLGVGRYSFTVMDFHHLGLPA